MIPNTNSPHTHTPLTLVLGGSGKTGRRIVERLQADGIALRSGSRAGQPPFNWEDPSTWGPALQNVSAAYISYYPDLTVPGAPEAVASFAKMALEHGVRRLVLLSGRGEEEAQRAEQLLSASGAEWTILRCSWFMQNFSESFFLEPILAGTVALPVKDVPEPFVDAEDIADVAVAALTQPGHIGRLYELTGPRPLTFAQAIREIADAAGRPVAFQPVSMDAFAATLSEQGQPADVIQILRYLFGEVLDGRNAHVADGVEQALGRKAHDFTQYARAAAATGVWRTPHA